MLDDGNYTLADSICNAGLERFPGSRSFLWPRLSLLERQERWTEALDLGKDLLQKYLALPDNNGYETTGLYWKLMKLSDRLGHRSDAKFYARAGLDTYRTPDATNRRQNKLNDLRERLNRD